MNTVFDENQSTIILNAQNGDEQSWELIISYFKPKARSYAYYLFPTKAFSIQGCDLEAAFFLSIEQSVKSFRPGRNRFESYFITIFKNELIRIFERMNADERNIALSMEGTIPGTDDTLVFADSLPLSTEDDKTYLDIEYATELYRETVKKIDDPLAVKIAEMRRENKTFQEISEELGISSKSAWLKFQKYIEAMKRAFKRT